ncbi:DUF362 domain-containing protein [Chloroflexota bacterium]
MFYVDEARCTGCEACIEVCTEGAITLRDSKAVIDQELCIRCGSCSELCMAGAIYRFKMPTVTPKVVAATIPHSSPEGSKKPGIVATRVSLAPMAIYVLLGLRQRWFLLRKEQSSMPGTHLGRGARFRRRWRGGRC